MSSRDLWRAGPTRVCPSPSWLPWDLVMLAPGLFSCPNSLMGVFGVS